MDRAIEEPEAAVAVERFDELLLIAAPGAAPRLEVGLAAETIDVGQRLEQRLRLDAYDRRLVIEGRGRSGGVERDPGIDRAVGYL